MLNSQRTLIAIAVLAFALRLAYAAASGELRAPQVWETEQIATNLIEHHEFTFHYGNSPLTSRAYIEPMYPFVAAGVYLVTNHSLMAMVLLQLLIAAATVWLLGRVATLASGRGDVGVVAALLMAVHPGFIRYSCILHPLVFDTFFFVAAGGAVIRYRQLPTFRRALAAAAVIGLGVLTRPTILLFLLPLVWIAWRTSETLKTRLMRSAAVVALTLAIIAPWTIRNAIVLHDFVLTRSGSGFVFWLGHNPSATGSAIDSAGTPVIYKSPELQKRIWAADELTRDRIYTEEATTYIRRDPAAAIVRIGNRLAYFWWFSPQWGILYSPAAKLVYVMWWMTLLFLWIAGAAVCRRFDVWFLSAMAFLISCGQSVYYVEGRHRLSIESLILPMAAIGVLWLLQRLENRFTTKTQRSQRGFLCVLCVFVVQSFRLTPLRLRSPGSGTTACRCR
jgi:4-amino-4-deoxy-L-arabinose transferase-like glycosyltransferase